MGETEESLEPQSVLSDLHDAVDAVFLALENNNEWGLIILSNSNLSCEHTG